MATLLEMTEILAGAMPLYPNFKKPAGQEAKFFFSTWHRYVAHLPAADLQAAMDMAVINHPDYFPTPGHVLEQVGLLKFGAAKTGLEAWAELRQAISDYDFYCPPDGAPPAGIDNWQVRKVWHFGDPLIAKLLPALGGWAAVCEMTEDKMVSARSQFVKAYELMAASERYHAADKQPQLVAPAIQIEAELSMDEVQDRLRQQVEQRHKMAVLTAGIGKP
jgi:hypothetical protein